MDEQPAPAYSSEAQPAAMEASTAAATVATQATSSAVSEGAATVKPAKGDAEVKAAKDDTQTVSTYFGLFKYADWKDKLLMFLGSICAVAFGIITPMISLVIGGVLNAILKYSGLKSAIADGVAVPQPYLDAARQNFETEVIRNVLLFLYIGCGAFAAAYFMVPIETSPID